jgi:hypothetical protein
MSKPARKPTGFFQTLLTVIRMVICNHCRRNARTLFAVRLNADSYADIRDGMRGHSVTVVRRTPEFADLSKSCRQEFLILQAVGKRGRCSEGLVYTDGKMLPPLATLVVLSQLITVLRLLGLCCALENLISQ